MHYTAPAVNTCTYCRRRAGELPTAVVYRDALCAAFIHIHPVNPGHVWIVPLAHAEFVADVARATVAHLAALVTAAVRLQVTRGAENAGVALRDRRHPRP